MIRYQILLKFHRIILYAASMKQCLHKTNEYKIVI